MSLLRRHFLKLLGTGTLGMGLNWGTESPEDSSSRAVPRVDRSDWPPETSLESDEAFWKLVQQQFPLTDTRTHLNTAGLGPAPYPVLEAARATRMELQRRSETGVKQLWAAREPVAEFFGARAEEIAFQRNATEGNSTVASGLEMAEGEEAMHIYNDHEDRDRVVGETRAAIQNA